MKFGMTMMAIAGVACGGAAVADLALAPNAPAATLGSGADVSSKFAAQLESPLWAMYSGGTGVLSGAQVNGALTLDATGDIDGPVGNGDRLFVVYELRAVTSGGTATLDALSVSGSAGPMFVAGSLASARTLTSGQVISGIIETGAFAGSSMDGTYDLAMSVSFDGDSSGFFSFDVMELSVQYLPFIPAPGTALTAGFGALCMGVRRRR